MDEGSRIHLCGRLRVSIAGQPREGQLHGRQGRLLLAFLVLRRGAPVTRDALVEAIWGATGLPPSEGALAPVLSRLRKCLAPATLEGRDTLALVVPEPVWVDVETAYQALERARAAGDAGERLAAAQEAAEIAQAELLPGLEADWIKDERLRLDRVRMEALELGAQAARLSQPALAERLARSAIAAAPFRESAWAALIGALEAQGNVAEALQAYDEVRQLLRDELGAVPSRELADLHAGLLKATEKAPSGPPSSPAPRPGPGQGLSEPTRITELVEREHELQAIDSALHGLVSGQGTIVLIEGPAGIGKTRLLEELRRSATGLDVLVLTARAGLLEREFAFGVVRQLLEEVSTPELLEGPAAAARAVLSDSGPAEGTFPILNGLFRLVERLAAERPLVLCVDDLQWSDPASLRFTAYLARRVAALQILIAATVRTGEPDSDEALLGDLAHEPVAISVLPRPLTVDATTTLLRSRLGRDPDLTFTLACHDVTAGNPLLLGQLTGALAAENIAPDDQGAEAVRAIGPRAVARTVLHRLSRLPAPAVRVAQAVAVLGEQPELPAVAALADADEAMAARAVQNLARAEILRADQSLGFVHPLIRDAVYGELTAPERALEHERAARLLADLGASPERVAAQLLLAPSRGDAWVVTRLREAAHLALRRGAPDAAMRLLERAQEEPPPPEQQAALAFELGGSAAYLRGPAGIEPLQRAYAGLSDPGERARAAIRLSHLLLFVRSPTAGVELAHSAAAELPAEFADLHDGLRAVRLVGATFGAVDPAEYRALDDVRGGPRGTGPGARALTAMTALAVALTCGPADEASALAREAFSGGLEQFEITAPVALGSAALALGEPAEGLDAIARYAEHARRQGEILGSIGADLWGGITHIWAGNLPAAMDSLGRAYEGERLWGTKLDAVMAYSAAFTALARLERGDPTEEVTETLHRIQASDPRPDGARFWLASAGELALAEGRASDAVEISQRLEPTRPADTHPVWAPWRSIRARALAALDKRDEARRLAQEDLDLARQVGAAWVVGRSIRILAELGGPDRVPLAREAVSHLEQTSARLELAKAHLALGLALAEEGLESEAFPELEAAANLARTCGAAGLARLATEVPSMGRAAAAGRRGR
jgi:DNA-binding SARP family transcriptional activator